MFRAKGEEYVCAPTPDGKLRVTKEGAHASNRRLVFDNAGLLHSSDLSHSLHTLIYDFISTRSAKLFLVDIAAVPICGHYIPKVINQAGLTEWLQEWKDTKLPCARDAALMALRQGDDVSVRPLQRPLSVKQLHPR